MATRTHGPHEVTATYAEMSAARRAIAALERHGVPGSDITLEGPGAVEAASDPDQSGTDERFMHEASKSVFGGAAIGAAIGAVVGAVAGLLLIGGLGAALGAAAGLAGGGALGFIVGALARLQESDAAALTYGPSHGQPAVVAVRTEKPADAAKAEDLLSAAEPQALQRVDAR